MSNVQLLNAWYRFYSALPESKVIALPAMLSYRIFYMGQQRWGGGGVGWSPSKILVLFEIALVAVGTSKLATEYQK